MSRSGSPSLAINGIPPDLLSAFLERARREGWASKNQVVIELMRMYVSGEVNLGTPPPAIEETNAAKLARAHGLGVHGKMIHEGPRHWIVWVQGFQDDRPNSSWLRASLVLQAVGAPAAPLTLIVTKENLVVEHAEGDTNWILEALRGWLLNPDRPAILNLG